MVRPLHPLRFLVPLLLLAALFVLLAAPSRAEARPGMVVGIEQFGMMEDPAKGPIMMDTQRDYGAKVIRYIVRWDWVAKCDPRTKGSATDPNNPCYTFGATDFVVAQANARGMQVLLSIWGTPSWVHNNPSQSYVGRSDAQFMHFVDRFAEFSQAATTRFDGRHGHGRVTQWTIWNEPNGNFFEPRWEGTKLIGPARYARLYDTAARRIKAVDPTLRVAVGPTAPLARELPPITFMEGVLPLLEQWKSPIDAWGHNAYIAGQSPFATTITSPRVGLGNIKDLTDELDQYSVTRDKPIWITEFGYRTGTYGSDAISNELQAIRTADALRFAWLNPRIETFIWYSLQDEGGEKGFNSGLFHPSNVTCSTKLCPKPAALVFQRTLWLSGRSASGAVVVWGQSRVDPAATKIFVQAPGEGWRAYANADTAQTGTVEAKLLLPLGTKVMTCDKWCAPARTVEGSTSGGGATTRVIKQKAVVLKRATTIKRGFRFVTPCKGCRVTAVLTAKGKVSGIASAKQRSVVVGRARPLKVRTGVRMQVRLTAAARRELAKRRRSTLVLRTFVTTGAGAQMVYERSVVLR